MMVEGNLRSIAAYLATGFNVIGELFVWYEGDLALAREILRGFHVAVIALESPIHVLEERERQRQATYDGFVRSQAEGPPFRIPADLVLQTDKASPEELASRVADWLNSSPNVEAFWRTHEPSA